MPSKKWRGIVFPLITISMSLWPFSFRISCEREHDVHEG